MISSPIINNNNNNNNTTAISLQNNNINNMNNNPQDDVFTQLYQALTPSTTTMAMAMVTPYQEPSSVFDEWLKQDFLSSECSVNSSPEIATPLDQFLMSPPFQSKDDMLSHGNNFAACAFGLETDLDVSAILDSPVPQHQFFNVAAAGTPTISVAQTPLVSVPATPTITPMTNLFADIGESLPAALAALAAVAAPDTPVVTKAEMSPAVASASTPTFSTKTNNNKKRSASTDEDGEPIDDAAVKRQKNTDAARRSRLRKVQKMGTLETRVSELEKINAGLLMRVAVLDSEKTNLKAKESSYESRIKVLEEQLAEAHKALSSRS
jgi:hypothetical protein